MAYRVYPTENDVGSASATGQVMTESNMATMVQALMRRPSAVKSGLALSAGTGLEVEIATGFAFVNGYLFEVTATESFTPAASENKALYLRLDYTSDKVSGVTYVKTDSLDPIDDDHLLLGEYITDGSSVTSVDMSELVVSPGYEIGNYTGDSTTGRTISLSFTPRFVLVQGDNTSLGGDRRDVGALRARLVDSGEWNSDARVPHKPDGRMGVRDGERVEAGDCRQRL